MSLRRWKIFTDLRKNWMRIYFVVSVAIFSFLFGLFQSMFAPVRTIDAFRAEIKDWIANPKHKARLVPEKFLAPASTLHTGMMVEHALPGAYQGQTFMTGFFSDSPAIELVDMTGRVIHQWQVPFDEIWSESRKSSIHPWDTHLHGALLYPNGDVVFNFQYGGLIRIDKCSRLKWKLSEHTHHTIFQDEEGNLWVPSRKKRTRRMDRFPNVRAPFQEDYILTVAPDGQLLQEISILEVIFESQYESLLFANGWDGLKIISPPDGDLTHLNDIEILSSKMASAFPLFEAGDVLVSLKHLNLLMVLNPNTKQIKWSMIGPYLRQHDPDFLPTGRISVFDNRMDTDGGKTRGGSRILEIDPVTRTVVTVYGGKEGQFFYTRLMGDQQQLPNGNLLITNTETGQVFEVTAAGRIVWSFVNRWGKDSVAWIERAIRYPQGYMSPAGTQECSAVR